MGEKVSLRDKVLKSSSYCTGSVATTRLKYTLSRISRGKARNPTCCPTSAWADRVEQVVEMLLASVLATLSWLCISSLVRLLDRSVKRGAGENAMIITVRNWGFRVVKMLGARKQENWEESDGFLYLRKLIALGKSLGIPTIDALFPETGDVRSHRRHDNEY